MWNDKLAEAIIAGSGLEFELLLRTVSSSIKRQVSTSCELSAWPVFFLLQMEKDAKSRPKQQNPTSRSREMGF
jgi:hypothetical protein